MARVFLFILKTKHKTYTSNWVWAELENFVEKKSAGASIDRVYFSIDRARQIYIVNPVEHLIPTLHINTL